MPAAKIWAFRTGADSLHVFQYNSMSDQITIPMYASKPRSATGIPIISEYTLELTVSQFQYALILQKDSTGLLCRYKRYAVVGMAISPRMKIDQAILFFISRYFINSIHTLY
jgi:hypothetical protein